jgi:hypothetical protein
VRLHLYLRLMDAATWLRWDWLYWRALDRAADLTDWGEGADCGEGVPW